MEYSTNVIAASHEFKSSVHKLPHSEVMMEVLRGDPVILLCVWLVRCVCNVGFASYGNTTTDWNIVLGGKLKQNKKRRET